MRRYGRVAAIAILAAATWVVFRTVFSPTLDPGEIRVSVAEVGEIEAAVTASGTIVPEFEQVIAAPIDSRIDSILLHSGDSVAAGQSILRLDNGFIRIEHDKMRDELELQRNRKTQLEIQLQRSQADLQSSYDIKKLQTQYKGSQLERVKRLTDIGGATQNDLDAAQLDHNIAERELERLASNIENQQASLRADLKALDLEISIKESRLEEVRRQMALAETRAERDGVVTWINDAIGAAVRPGDVVARVADLGSFKVEATISDIHADKLAVGGPITIRIGDLRLPGRIATVRPAIEGGVVAFAVSLDNRSHEALRSNLRVDVAVITSVRRDVIRVENGPFFNGKNDQEIFILESDRAVRRIVDIGETNYDWVELKNGVAAGEKVIVSDMKEHRRQEELRLATN